MGRTNIQCWVQFSLQQWHLCSFIGWNDPIWSIYILLWRFSKVVHSSLHSTVEYITLANMKTPLHKIMRTFIQSESKQQEVKTHSISLLLPSFSNCCPIISCTYTPWLLRHKYNSTAVINVKDLKLECLKVLWWVFYYEKFELLSAGQA